MKRILVTLFLVSFSISPSLTAEEVFEKPGTYTLKGDSYKISIKEQNGKVKVDIYRNNLEREPHIDQRNGRQ